MFYFKLFFLSLLPTSIVLFFLLVIMGLPAQAQQVEQALIGTYSTIPNSGVTVHPGFDSFRSPTVVGPVVTFPNAGGYPVDWAALRNNRLAGVAEEASSSIFFEFNSAELREDSLLGLLELVTLLDDNPDVGLVLIGHTDLVGTAAFNFELGMRRAEATRKALLDLGVADNRLRAGSLGETVPLALVTGSESVNRRVEISIFDLFAAE